MALGSDCTLPGSDSAYKRVGVPGPTDHMGLGAGWHHTEKK